jgi:hypothetical protein
MDQFSSGFQTSQVEVIIFLGILGAILLSLAIGQIIRVRRKDKPRKRQGPPREPVLRSHSTPRVDRVELGVREQQTLDKLAWFLKDPSRSEDLLQDHSLLVKVGRRALREGVAQELEIIRLLRRVGADPAPLKSAPHTTYTVPAGAEASLSTPAMAMGTGVIQISEPAGLQILVSKGENNFNPGDPVDAVCYAPQGMYQFHTSVIGRTGKHLLLNHTNHVRFAQRRKYRRREIAMTVTITMPGINHKPLTGVTQDLSIGGAAITNPRKKLGIGAYVELAIEAGTAAPLVARGTVVRLSRRKKTAHVSFSGLDEKTRHRLFRRLIQAG